MRGPVERSPLARGGECRINQTCNPALVAHTVQIGSFEMWWVRTIFRVSIVMIVSKLIRSHCIESGDMDVRVMPKKVSQC